jgi:hypothetical protein
MVLGIGLLVLLTVIDIFGKNLFLPLLLNGAN